MADTVMQLTEGDRWTIINGLRAAVKVYEDAAFWANYSIDSPMAAQFQRQVSDANRLADLLEAHENITIGEP